MHGADGIAMSGYDPTSDLIECGSVTHAIFILKGGRHDEKDHDDSRGCNLLGGGRIG